MEIKETIIANNVGFGRFPDTATVFGLERMANTDFAEGIAFYVTGTFDQPVTLQAVGHLVDGARDLADLVDVGAGITLAIGSTTPVRLAMTINLQENRHSWYGLTVLTGGTAPTVGTMRAIARVEPRLAPDMEVGLAIAQMAGTLQEMRQTQVIMNQALQTLLGQRR